MRRAVSAVKPIPSAVKLMLRLSVTVGLYALLLSTVNVGELTQLLAAIDWRWLAAGLVIPLVGIPLSALRWRVLLHHYGVDRGYRELLLRYWSGSFYNTVLPGSVSGDIVRVGGLTRSGVSLALSTFSVLADRFIGLWFCLLIGLVSSLWPSRLPHRVLLGVVFVAGLSGSLLALWLLQYVRRSRWRWLDRAQSLVALLRVWPGWSLLLLALAFQCLVIVHLYVVARAVQAPISLLASGLYMPAVVLAALLPVSLNGLGIREAVLVVLLAGIGVSSEQATVVGLLILLTSTISSLPGGIAALLLPLGIKQDVQSSTF